MHDPMKSKSLEERSLADRLKDEARTTRPEFSAALHARIIERIAATQTTLSAPQCAEISRPPARTSAIRRSATPVWAGAAVAAALLLGIGGIWSGLSPRPARHDLGSTYVNRVADIPSEEARLPEDRLPDVRTPAVGDSAEGIGETVMLDQTELLDTTAQLVETALTAQQWAYLEHDAQVLANLLFDQVPMEARATGGL